MSKSTTRREFDDPTGGPIFSVRFILALVMIVAGIGWIAYYYLKLRDAESGTLAGLDTWNYAIGFGLIIVALFVSAHPSTPLGRGRGVVVGMLGSAIIGLLWIATYYMISTPGTLEKVPIFNDLGNYNLIVGIGFMGAAFGFATRWE